MKSLRHFLLIGFAITVGFTSCTTEKRLYMPGYNTSWNISKHNLEKQVVVNETAKLDEMPIFEELQTSTSTVDNSLAQQNTADNLTASVDNSHIFIAKKKGLLAPSDKVIHSRNSSFSIAKTVQIAKKEIKNRVRDLKEKKAHASDGNGSFALRLIGWVVIVAGLISLFLIPGSLWVGVVLMLLGLVFVVVGRR